MVSQVSTLVNARNAKQLARHGAKQCDPSDREQPCTNSDSKVETATSRETGSHFSVPLNTHETGTQGTCDSHTVQANSTSTGTMSNTETKLNAADNQVHEQ